MINKHGIMKAGGVVLFGSMLAACTSNPVSSVSSSADQNQGKSTPSEHVPIRSTYDGQVTGSDGEVWHGRADKKGISQQPTSISHQLKSRQSSISKSSDRIRCPALPEKVSPGICVAKVITDPVYVNRMERRLVKEAYERVEIIPAEYKIVEKKILYKEGYEEKEIVPAEYKWVEERVLVKPAYERTEEIPAMYNTFYENVLVEPAKRVWKPGNEAAKHKNIIHQETIDEATGAVMCLVEIPGRYEMKERKVLLKPATTRQIKVPAEYKTVKKRVLTAPETTRIVRVIPPSYKTIKVRELVKPETERRVKVPAQYGMFPVKVLKTEARCEWREVLCKVNATKKRVTQIQNALWKAGYNPGSNDGVLRQGTFEAVNAYQQKKGLPIDPIKQKIINIKTVKSLGVSLRN